VSVFAEPCEEEFLRNQRERCPVCRGTGFEEGIDQSNPTKLSVRPCPEGCESDEPDDMDAAYDRKHDEDEA